MARFLAVVACGLLVLTSAACSSGPGDTIAEGRQGPGAFTSPMPTAVRVDPKGTAWFLVHDDSGAIAVQARDASGWSGTYKVKGGPEGDGQPALHVDGHTMLLAYYRCTDDDCSTHVLHIERLARVGDSVQRVGAPFVSKPRSDSPDFPRYIGNDGDKSVVNAGRLIVRVDADGTGRESTLPAFAGDTCVVAGDVVTVTASHTPTSADRGSVPSEVVASQSSAPLEVHLLALGNGNHWSPVSGSELAIDTASSERFRCTHNGLERAEPGQLSKATWNGTMWSQRTPAPIAWDLVQTNDGPAIIGVRDGRVRQVDSVTGTVKLAADAPSELAERWSAPVGAIDSAHPGPVLDPVAIGGPAASPTAATCYLNSLHESKQIAHCVVF